VGVAERRPIRWPLTVALSVLLAGPACAGSEPSGPRDPGGAELVVHAEASALLTGDTIPLAVRTLDGAEVPSAEVTWASSDPSVAEVRPGGKLVGLGPGSVTITARRGEQHGGTAFDIRVGRGLRVPGMASYDRRIPELMAHWGIPGGAVAVVKDGRLVYARGYGMADADAGEAVEPAALFRIASVSKPITAAAVLLLVERGDLDLDDPAFALLPDLEPPDGATADPRLSQITVRHLLHHAGGWDRNTTFDPMFRAIEAAGAVGEPAPASAETVIRYMLGQPLQFDPGTRYAYSNFGYAVLGRIVERVTGVSYEAFVREEVLTPLGVVRTVVGGSRLADRLPGEVRYHDAAVVGSVFPGEGQVPIAYGGFHLEAMDAHGGWVSSTVDLLRFLTGVDGRPVPGDLLSPASVAAMVGSPPSPLWAGSAYYYGMGWLVRPTGSDANWWHDGSLPGTTTLLVRAYHGVSWVALFNRRASSGGMSFAAALDGVLWEALAAVTDWPGHDLFPHLP
jgi:CubicO group peptidase (beta-lactamase class C family)